MIESSSAVCCTCTKSAAKFRLLVATNAEFICLSIAWRPPRHAAQARTAKCRHTIGRSRLPANLRRNCGNFSGDAAALAAQHRVVGRICAVRSAPSVRHMRPRAPADRMLTTLVPMMAGTLKAITGWVRPFKVSAPSRSNGADPGASPVGRIAEPVRDGASDPPSGRRGGAVPGRFVTLTEAGRPAAGGTWWGTGRQPRPGANGAVRSTANAAALAATRQRRRSERECQTDRGNDNCRSKIGAHNHNLPSPTVIRYP